MANRHLARSIVMQTLFGLDFNPIPESDIHDMFLSQIQEFAPGIEDTTFVESLLLGVIKKRTIIDEVIQKAAPEWPLDKINAVDRNVLRLGLYELLFGSHDQVPPKVAINEAIELAKTFGGESSGRFVNGVLGAVYKELGEPGKDQKSKKVAPPEIPYDQMPIEKKAGAVVYALHEGQYYLAMLHDVFGFWTLSKSGMKGDETAEQAAMRAIKEEMNLDIRIVEKLGEYEYIANHPEKGKIRKQVHYFLGEAQYTPLTLGKSGGLDDVQWFPITDVTELRMYENITQLIIQSAGILLGDTVNTDTNSEINSDTSANTDINSDTTTIDSSTK